MNLLDVFLTLMHEQQLRWDITAALRRVVHRAGFVVVLLDCEIPKCDLVVSSGGCENGIFCRVPFNGSDWPSMP